MMTMMMTIDQQLARLAHDIAAANEADAGAKVNEVAGDLEHLERRAHPTARAVAEQLGASIEAGDDEIDLALELIFERLLDPARAAEAVECSSALAA